MVSVNPNPAQGFYFFDPMSMGLPGLNSLPLQPQMNSSSTTTPTNTTPTVSATVNNTAVGNTARSSAANTMTFSDDPNKKIRKPYTITKSRESWTDEEHDKFLEALQLFDRDWKKIEAFIGSKTVIQIRSHAQKYFLKVQKNGTSEHVPPPRPKRKAAHPYPQKAPKTAPVGTQVTAPFQATSAPLELANVYKSASSSVNGNPLTGGTLTAWSYNSMAPVTVSQAAKEDVGLSAPKIGNNCCCSSSNESTPRTRQSNEIIDGGEKGKPMRVMPDFAQVYSFIGSVFDPHSSGHLQRLKQMDPINLETVLLLMRNLSVNLTSPKFEDHRRLLASCDMETEEPKSGGSSGHASAAKMIPDIHFTSN